MHFGEFEDTLKNRIDFLNYNIAISRSVEETIAIRAFTAGTIVTSLFIARATWPRQVSNGHAHSHSSRIDSNSAVAQKGYKKAKALNTVTYSRRDLRIFVYLPNPTRSG